MGKERTICELELEMSKTLLDLMESVRLDKEFEEIMKKADSSIAISKNEYLDLVNESYPYSGKNPSYKGEMCQVLTFIISNKYYFNIYRDIIDQRDMYAKVYKVSLTADFEVMRIMGRINYEEDVAVSINIKYHSFKELFNDFYAFSKMTNKQLLKNIAPLVAKKIYGGENE